MRERAAVTAVKPSSAAEVTVSVAKRVVVAMTLVRCAVVLVVVCEYVWLSVGEEEESLEEGKLTSVTVTVM